MLLLNGQLLNESEVQFPVSNRAFQYNDGFFETAIIKYGKLRFWHDHLERIKDAAYTLQLELPESLLYTLNGEPLLQLAELNKAAEYGRLKLKVWRSGSGLYTPETNSTEWLITVQPALPVALTPVKVGFCQKVFTSYTSFSHFKGPNSLVYVLAAMEKKQRALDDVVLLSSEGFISEMTSSNIFWISGNEVYTPALTTGCINGILRRNVLRWCAERSIKVNEVLASINELYQAEAVFSANVTGIRMISEIENSQFATSHPLITDIRNGLQV